MLRAQVEISIKAKKIQFLNISSGKWRPKFCKHCGAVKPAFFKGHVWWGVDSDIYVLHPWKLRKNAALDR